MIIIYKNIIKYNKTANKDDNINIKIKLIKKNNQIMIIFNNKNKDNINITIKLII